MNLLQMSISGAVLILAIGLVRLMFLRIVPKRTFFILWIVVLARLLIPFEPIIHIDVPFPQIQISAFLSKAQETVPADYPSQNQQTVFTQPSQEAETDGANINSANLEVPPAAQAAPAQDQHDGTKLSVSAIVWAVGALMLGTFFVVSYTAGYKRFRLALPVENADACAWINSHTLRRGLMLKSLRCLDSPMTYGIFHPVILVPQISNWWSNSDVKYSLEHEYIHVCRFDTATKLALSLALTIHWFNPAVWLFYALANRDIELSCDEAVLLRLGEAERSRYARALLAAEERRAKMPVLYASFGANTTKERIVEIMKFKKKSVASLFFAVLIVLSLAACAASAINPQNTAVKLSDVSDSTIIPDSTGNTDGEKTTTNTVYTNYGLTLTIPSDYDRLLLVDAPQNDENGVVFTVAERESADAAKSEGHEDWGMGWLFSIGRIGEERLHEMLSYDMSGADVFAKDNNGNYYVFYHPTDVRFYRSEGNTDESAWEQWEVLSKWAWSEISDFITQNPVLTAYHRTNTDVDIYLSRLAYIGDVSYTLGSTAYGILDADGVDPQPYLERLLKDVTIVGIADDVQPPDGEYIVMNLPEFDARLDFFLAGDGNYIRSTMSGNELLFHAAYADNKTRASDIMSEWCDTLAKVNETRSDLPAVTSTPSAAPNSMRDSKDTTGSHERSDVDAAEEAARAYYKQTVFTVIDMQVKSQTVNEIIFSVRSSKDGIIQEPDRSITLNCDGDQWIVVGEGY